jgi:hypothetical protein
MSTAAKVAQHKEKNPAVYCPNKRCLWRTGGGYCPRHQRVERDAPVLATPTRPNQVNRERG